MLNDFKELQADLDKDGRLNSRSLAIRDILTTQIMLYECQHEYAEAEKNDPVNIMEDFKGFRPLTDRELDNLREAKEINRSIGKRLGAIKKVKKNATKK